MQTEPARIIGYATTLVTAILALLVAFGNPMTEEQRNAIIQVVVAFGAAAIFAVELIRSKVNSPATLHEESKRAYIAGVKDGQGEVSRG